MSEQALSPFQIFLILSAVLWVFAFAVGGNKAATRVLNAFMLVLWSAFSIGIVRKYLYGVPLDETRDAVISFVVGGGVLTSWLAGLVLFSPVGLVFLFLWLMSIPARQAAAIQQRKKAEERALWSKLSQSNADKK